MKANHDVTSGVLTVTVEGDLNSTKVKQIQPSLEPWLETKPESDAPWRVLRLELPVARMVDSVGLNLIVYLLKAAQRRNGKVQVVYRNSNIHRTFLFTRLDKQLELINQAA